MARSAPHPFADLIGLRFEPSTPGESLCVIDVGEALMNPHRVVHGGVLYSMADTGMGAALYPSLAAGELCATIEIKIAYFKPVAEGRISCRTRITHRGRRTAHLESELRSGDVLVAKASGSYAIFKPGTPGH
ncbi:MAG: hypothetical protein RIS35_1632 [Pseudomonadota bacterium]